MDGKELLEQRLVGQIVEKINVQYSTNNAQCSFLMLTQLEN